MMGNNATRYLITAGIAACLLGCAFKSTAQGLPLPAWSQAGTQGIAFDSVLRSGAMPFFMDSNSFMVLLLGPWKDYARDRLLPDWGVPLDLPQLPDEQRLDRQDGFLPGFAQRLLHYDSMRHHFGLDVQSYSVPATPLLPDDLNHLRFDGSSAQLKQTLYTPTYAYELSSTSSIGVSAVLAYQDFSTYGFGNFSAEHAYFTGRYGETAFGTGLRFGLRNELAPGLAWGASYQTHIEMDPFYRYRGVYSEPGQFDIPASAGLGLMMDATGSVSLSFDVRHIQYSDVEPFTSALLPNRFLSLLGDGTSPEFAWQDLTVYRIGWDYQRDASDLIWSVDWSSARQPHPTSRLLANALAPQFAENYWTVGLSGETSEFGRLSLSASYTPADYFLSLNGNGYEADGALDRMEIEARWTVDF